MRVIFNGTWENTKPLTSPKEAAIFLHKGKEVRYAHILRKDFRSRV